MDSRSTSLDDLLRLAREDLARNSLSSAEKNLEQAVLLNNQVPEAFHLLGYVYSKKGKFKKAIMAFERALTLDPFHTEAAIALSSLYNDVGKYREGAQVFHKTKKRLDRTQPGFDPRINHSLAQKHYEMGMTYMRFERFQEAHREFLKAHNLEPENIMSAVQMAKCLAKCGDRPAAIQLLQKTLEKNAKSVDAKIQLGILYHSEKRVNEAAREWQEALALDPENGTAQMYVSMVESEAVSV